MVCSEPGGQKPVLSLSLDRIMKLPIQNEILIIKYYDEFHGSTQLCGISNAFAMELPTGWIGTMKKLGLVLGEFSM